MFVRFFRTRSLIVAWVVSSLLALSSAAVALASDPGPYIPK